MDRITSIAYMLYHSSEDPEVKARAVDLLNGETNIRELKADPGMLHLVETAEARVKKNPANKEEIQKFVEEHLLVEA